MAQVSNIYLNVADGVDDIDTATQHLISTMKAFSIEADDAMGAVDKINEVANNYALSMSDIGEALTRSSAAMELAGASLDETIAMITATQEILQNAETVGTVLKTFSMRVRGTKVELEEAGLETDGMAESTSKLREQILALTNVTGKGGVDILGSADEYRDIYDIMDDIAGVYKDMTDMNQAALVELLGGKRGGQALSAMLNNWESARRAMQSMQDAEGSALRENQRYLESIEGKLNQLSSSWQGLWDNTIPNGLLKGLIDMLNAIVQKADQIGVLNIAFSALAATIANIAFNLKQGKEYPFISTLINQVTKLKEAYADIQLLTSHYGAENVGFIGELMAFDTAQIQKDIQSVGKLKDAIKGVNFENITDKQFLFNTQEFQEALDGMSDTLRDKVVTGLNLATDNEMAHTVATEADTIAQLTNEKALTLRALKLNLLKIGLMAAAAATVYAISKYKEYREEEKRRIEQDRQARIEAAETAKELYNVANAYERAKEAYESDPSKENAYREAVDKVVSALGDKAKALEGLSEDSKEYIKVLEELTEAELQSYTALQREGLQAARNSARDNLKTTFGSKGNFRTNLSSSASQTVRQAIRDNLTGFSGGMTDTGDFNLTFSYDAKNVGNAMAAFASLKNVLAEMQKEADLAGKSIEDFPEYYKLIGAYNEMEEYILEIYEHEVDLYDARQREAGQIPTTVEEYKRYKEGLLDVNSLTEEQIEIYEDLIAKLYPQLEREQKKQEKLHDTLSNVISGSNKQIVESYKKAEAELEKLSDKSSNGSIGNINFNSQTGQTVLLEEQDLEKHKNIINQWKLSTEDLKRFNETSLIKQTYDGVDFAITPVMVDPITGDKKPLTPKQVQTYLDELKKEAEAKGIEPTPINLFELDKEGLEIDGNYISNLIAGWGDDLESIFSDASLWAGFSLAFNLLVSSATEAGESWREFVKDYTDNIDLAKEKLDELDEKLTPTQTEAAIEMLKDHDYMLQQNIDSIDDFIEALTKWQEKQKEIILESSDLVDKFNSAAEAIDGFQDTVSSMSSIMEQSFSGSMDVSSYIDNLQAVASKIKELRDNGEDGAKSLAKAFNNLSFGNLKELGNLAERVTNQQLKSFFKAMEEDYGITFDANARAMITSMAKVEAQVKGASAGLSNLASAYGTVMNAIQQYNEDGFMTISTITSLLSLEPQYLQMLDMEGGQLRLNEQALNELAKARIEDAKAAAYANAEAQISAITNEAAERTMIAVEEAEIDAAKAGVVLANGATIAAGGMDTATTAAKNYVKALGYAEKLNKQGKLTDAEQREIQNIRTTTDRQVAIYDQMYTAISKSGEKARDKAMGYTNSAAENAEKKAEEVAKQIKSNIDSTISAWKKALDQGGITYEQYLNKIAALAKKYRGYLTDQEYAEYEYQVLEGRKEMYEKAASAVQNYLNRNKQGIQDQITAVEEQISLIERQQEAIDESYQKLITPLEKRSKELEKQKKILEAEVEAITEQYQLMLDPLQAQLKILQKQADEIQKIIDGINAFYDNLTTPLSRRVEDLEYVAGNLERTISDIEEKWQKLIDPVQNQVDTRNAELKELNNIIKVRQNELEAIEEKYKTEIENNEKIIKSYQKIVKQLEKNIAAYEKEREAVEASMQPILDMQADYNEQIHMYQDMQREINAEIRGLERLKSLQEDLITPLQEELDKLNEANDARDKAMQLARAEAALQKALNQRTRLVYTGGQFEYQADRSAVRDAQDQLSKLQGEAQVSALEKAIKDLQTPIDEIDRKLQLLQKRNQWISWDIEDINDLLHETEHMLAPYEKQISEIEAKIKDVQSEVSIWNEKVSELTEKNELLNELMEQATQPLRDIITNLERQASLIEDEIDLLTLEIEHYEKLRDEETKEHRVKLEGINREISALNDEIRQYEYLRNVELREHNDKLANLNSEISKLNESISAIEEERDVFLDAKQKEISALEKVISKISDEISELEDLRDAEKEAFEPMLKDLEKQKQALQDQVTALEKYAQGWQDVIDKWQQIQDEKLLENMFGENWQQMLDSLDPKLLNDFGDAYINVCQDVANYAEKMAQMVEESIERIDDALGNATVGVNDWGGAASDAAKDTEGLANEIDKTAHHFEEYKKKAQPATEQSEKFSVKVKNVGGQAGSAKSNVGLLADKLLLMKTNTDGAGDNVGKLSGPLKDLAVVKATNDSIIVKGPQGIKEIRTNGAGAASNAKTIANELEKTNKEAKSNSILSKMLDAIKGGLSNVLDKFNTSGTYNAASTRSNVVTGTLISVKRMEKGGRVDIPTAAKGRRVEASNILSDIAKALGEDTMVAAKVGEGIFTKRQTDDLEEFIQLTPSLIKSTQSLQNIAKIFESTFDRDAFRPNAVQNYVAQAVRQADRTSQGLAASTVHNEQNLSFNMGDVIIQHADNASDLARQIKQNFPNAALQALMAN